jgi:hypothetical protein
MMTTADLADRIRRLEDRAAIADLAIRYCVAIDDSDYAGMVQMYTAKATLGPTVGRQEVVDQLRSIRSTYGRTIHVPEAHLITFTDADHATGIVLSHAELDIQGRTIRCYIRYYDQYERGPDDVWRFADRTLKVAYALPVEDLADSLAAPDPVRWPGTEPAPADAF